MTLLAIESSTPNAELALWRDGETVWKATDEYASYS